MMGGENVFGENNEDVIREIWYMDDNEKNVVKFGRISGMKKKDMY